MRTVLTTSLIAGGLIAGCADGAGPAEGSAPITTPPPETTAPPPSDYIFDADTTPVPTASLAELGEALQTGLDLTLTITATPVQEAYDAVMDSSTLACPYVYATPDGEYWYDSCTASDGTEFDGYVFAYEENDLYDPYSGLVFDYWYAFGGATVEDAQGHQLELAGGAVWQKGVGESGGVPLEYYITDIGGTFRWDGPEARGTWLEAGLDPDLTVITYAVPILDASSTTLAGGFGGFADGWALAYDNNTVGSAILGLPCEDELSGTVGLRAPDGTWYDIQFQGSDGTDPDYDAAQCDGCGQAFYQGEPMGEVCADVSTLIAMGVAPW
ncbi:MAG: hypothetical protein ABMB14_15585 [Myxococcota bacterium]